MIKCQGCGATIQTTNPNQIGYIRKDVFERGHDQVYCERCYKLIHYNQNTNVEISIDVFYENIKKINQKDVLIVNVVDIFDLEGTLIEDIRKYFPKQDILIVANKFDLFLKSVKIGEVKKYLEDYLEEKRINQKSSIIISSFIDEDIIRLANLIEMYQNGRDVYFFGYTNVGKSSIINKLISYYNINRQKVTVSTSLSTTLDLIDIPLPNNTHIFDMPGIINPRQLSYYLEKENLNLLLPKKQVKPKVYQLEPKQVLFLGGVCKFIFNKGSKSTFVVYTSNNLVIHRTKLSNYQKFYDEHKDDILKIPNPNERNQLGRIIKYHFSVNEEEKVDITISGLGFVTIVGNVELTLEVFENIKIGKRKAII